jgi:hypothetical protein
MTIAEYRKRLKSAESKEKHFLGLRNAWRAIVKRRGTALAEAIKRSRRDETKPHLVGRNQVRGGTAQQRLLFAMEKAHEGFRHYYSEGGSWVKGYALTNVPRGAYRSDCSWWYTMLRYACNLQGPSLEGGYTGTILIEGKRCSREHAEKTAGIAVVFGSGTAFHVAMSTGKGPTVYQHGVPEVDTGTFDQFGPSTEVRFRSFPDKPR